MPATPPICGSSGRASGRVPCAMASPSRPMAAIRRGCALSMPSGRRASASTATASCGIASPVAPASMSSNDPPRRRAGGFGRYPGGGSRAGGLSAGSDGPRGFGGRVGDKARQATRPPEVAERRPEPANNALDHHRLAAQAPVYLALARLCPVSLHDQVSIDKTRWPRLPLLAR